MSSSSDQQSESAAPLPRAPTDHRPLRKPGLQCHSWDLLGGVVFFQSAGFHVNAVLTASSNSSALNGLIKYATVQSEAASDLAQSSDPCAVMKITGTLNLRASSRRWSSMPLIPGSRTSNIRQSALRGPFE